MERPIRLFVWLLLVLFALAPAGPFGAERSHARAQDNKRAQWEYAELSLTVTESRLQTTKRMSLETADKEESAESFTALAKKVGYTLKKDTSTAFLNALGADGWKLTNQWQSLSSGGEMSVHRRVWTFERRKE